MNSTLIKLEIKQDKINNHYSNVYRIILTMVNDDKTKIKRLLDPFVAYLLYAKSS